MRLTTDDLIRLKEIYTTFGLVGFLEFSDRCVTGELRGGGKLTYFSGQNLQWMYELGRRQGTGDSPTYAIQDMYTR